MHGIKLCRSGLYNASKENWTNADNIIKYGSTLSGTGIKRAATDREDPIAQKMSPFRLLTVSASGPIIPENIYFLKYDIFIFIDANLLTCKQKCGQQSAGEIQRCV